MSYIFKFSIPLWVGLVTLHFGTATSRRHHAVKCSREIRFCEFTPKSSAFFLGKKIWKWFCDFCCHWDHLSLCSNQSHCGNAHTDPLFNSLKLLKIKDIFDVQCMKFWYKFVNNNVPTYFASMFRYNHELYEIQTRSHELLHLYPFRTSNAHNALRHRIPELLCKFPTAVLEKARTHSIMSFASHVKFHLIDSYCSECMIPQCYICARST